MQNSVCCLLQKKTTDFRLQPKGNSDLRASYRHEHTNECKALSNYS